MIYADYNATTPMLPEALATYNEIEHSTWGNASSIHTYGRNAKALLEQARNQLARLLGAEPNMVLFTSGGSEANNWVVRDFCHPDGCSHIVLSAVEHSSVVRPAKKLQPTGKAISFIAVDRSGNLDRQAYLQALKKKVGLVSLMAANNETGVIFPTRELASLAKEHGALIHCDASQMIGKQAMHFKNDGCDFMTVSAHKFYGPKGVGALVVRDRQLLESMCQGGGQEYGLRPGTENTAAIAAMVKALSILQLENYQAKWRQVKSIRDHFESQLKKQCAVSIHGEMAQRLPNTSNVEFIGMEAQHLMINLDLAGIACSSGSACHSGAVRPSHVLTAMGLSETQALASLRISFGLHSTMNEANQIVDVLVSTLKQMENRRRTSHARS